MLSFFSLHSNLKADIVISDNWSYANNNRPAGVKTIPSSYNQPGLGGNGRFALAE